MIFSKHNIFSKIHNSDKHFIINVLSGNADILSDEEALHINQKIYTDEFIEKGYVVEEDEENKIYRNKYLEFIDNRDSDEVQTFFVLSYACNFNCSYCYQDEYTNSAALPNTEIIDSFFRYINNEFVGKRKYITLFGGEPLMVGEKHMELVNYFVDKCNENNLQLAIPTNVKF